MSEECTPPDPIAVGKNFSTVDPVSCCARLLDLTENGGLAVDDGVGVRMASGAETDRIALPDIWKMDTPTFSGIMVLNDAGELFQQNAHDGQVPWALISRAGEWQIERLQQSHCWEPDLICGAECDPDYMAAWVETTDADGNAVLCLMKVPIPAEDGSISIFFQDTDTVQVDGEGTEGTPYRFNVVVDADSPIVSDGQGVSLLLDTDPALLSTGDGLKVHISSDPGNLIVLGTDGGLFVGNVYGDPLEEL